MAMTTYKKTQGRPTRQIALCVIVFCVSWLLVSAGNLVPLGAREWLFSFVGISASVGWLIVSLALIGVSGLLTLSLLNRPRWADFLISVQAEIDKVTWPSKAEVHKATIVVLVLLVSMAVVIFVFDVVWQWVFKTVGFLQI
ncbi:MAG: preprotein translocase subunit SecE [Planctomycetaceae bacterium]